MLWDHVGGQPLDNKLRAGKTLPAETPISKAMSKQLIGHGFKFVGPTIVYAFMQAVGMVNDHEVTCWCHAECNKLAAKHAKKKSKT
jgi:DNA-3-methyladenine glycosylase I